MTLPLGELEPLTCALLSVLLALVLAGIAGQETELLELATQFGIELNQCPCDAETGRAGLACEAAAVGEDQHIEFVGRFRCQERLTHHSPGGLGGEILVPSAAVDGDGALAGTQKNAGNGGLPPARSQMLY